MEKTYKRTRTNFKMGILFVGLMLAQHSFAQLTYCASGATSTADEDIWNVTVGVLNNTSTCAQTGGPGSTLSLYSNYTNVVPALPVPTLQIGVPTPMSVGVGTCGTGSFNNMTKVFIDYNQNGLFTDPGEQVYASSAPVMGVNTINFNFTVPFSALSGLTRMRIVTVETTLIANILPCGTYTWGETEDYTVQIGTPLPNDAGIQAFVNPLLPTCSFNDSVSVTLRNYGTDTLTSVNINWSRNGGTLAPIFWSGSLAPQQTTTVFVGTAPYTTGDDLCAWTTNPNGTIENASGSYNDSSCVFGLSTGLSGTFTIGGMTPDFNTILDAVNALNSAGICGPTTFNIRTGTYFDQFTLSQVTGMNATNTVTFRSEAGHRDSVVFDFGSTSAVNNFVVRLNNADYYRIQDMTFQNSGATFGIVMDVNGGSEYNIVTNCLLKTQANNTTSLNITVLNSTAGNDDFNRFENNTFEGGSYGVYWRGMAIASLEKGSEFINNECLNNFWYGMRIDFQENVLVTRNRIYGASTQPSRYGLYLNYCDKASVITNNSVESNATSHFVWPLYLNFCDGTSTARGLLANNILTSGTSTYSGLNYGMFINSSGFFDIYNNSVSIISGGSTSRVFYIANGGINNIKNNTFTNYSGGFAAYVLGTFAINEMDYNNLYTTGTQVAYFDVANTTTFSNWQTTTGYDMNGINVDPSFYGDYDLHVCADSLNGKGTPLALITDDFDGQPRNATTPDIGADEFSPLSQPGFLGPDTVVCVGQLVTLKAGSPTDVVSWSNGPTTTTNDVSIGTYTVTVIGACGLSFDTIVVAASNETYTNFLVADTLTFCTGGSVTLSSTMPATSYSWTGGTTDSTLVVTSGGLYTLNILDACGSGTSSITIAENSVPTASFTSTTSFLTGIFTNTSTVGGSPTYLWNFGDNNTSTEMNPLHIYSTIDTFTVTLTVTNACGSNTTSSTIITSNLGLEEIDGVGSIAVYPNPSNGVFNIDFNTNNDMNISVNVINVLGESVLVKNIGSINGTHKDAIDITNAAPGVYYVNILSNNEKVMTTKLVKQ